MKNDDECTHCTKKRTDFDSDSAFWLHEISHTLVLMLELMEKEQK